MLINIKNREEKVDFKTAVQCGLGRDGGLFLPPYITPMPHIQDLLELPFVDRSQRIMQHLIGPNTDATLIDTLIAQAFNFPLHLSAVDPHIYCLELFHGPTLAFKDFGARFMAQCLQQFNPGKKISIITATSGDTGAAVAHAFYGLENVEVHILYPHNKISPLQEKLFCTLGGNIKTYAVQGDFDDCQRMVKACFQDDEVNAALQLNSANSINIARLFAQVCYYFEACAHLQHNQLVIAVPSGNFGNLTAGVIARQLGAPIKRFIAATNANDTVPRFLHNQEWQPLPTKETASNAMDVSSPNNWPRIMYLLNNDFDALKTLIKPGVKSDKETFSAMQFMHNNGYLSEPHGAVAYACLQNELKEEEVGVFLGTAHPAKFKETVDTVLDVSTPLPEALAQVQDKQLLSVEVTNDTSAFKQLLLQ
ncbi:threonine synthase [Marinicella sp. W31]|uniref:threonine synthase n=1 Tax=Marinicella sp. W31 TaxID=3023713 RepID=UPI0037582FFB